MGCSVREHPCPTCQHLRRWACWGPCTWPREAQCRPTQQRGCFSGVNTFHELLGHPKPCVGLMFDSSKRGWVKSQVLLGDQDDSTRVLACPASVAWAWYQALEGISEDSRCYSAGLPCHSCLGWYPTTAGHFGGHAQQPTLICRCQHMRMPTCGSVACCPARAGALIDGLCFLCFD